MAICIQQVLTKDHYDLWNTYVFKRNNFVLISIDGIHYPQAFEVIMNFIIFPRMQIQTFMNLFDKPIQIVYDLAAYSYIKNHFKNERILVNSRMSRFINHNRTVYDLYEIAHFILLRQFGNLSLLYGMRSVYEKKIIHTCIFGPPCVCKCVNVMSYMVSMYPNEFIIPGFGDECEKLCLEIEPNAFCEKYSNRVLLSLYRVGIKEFLSKH